MNILHHKSWHVRTKKNIERVRRDEEKAAEEEKEKLRRVALAEQEARTDILRSRAKGKLTDNDKDVLESATSTDIVPTTNEVQRAGNINFFKEIEDGLTKQGINEEHQKEKRAEKEKWEKSVGLLTYLGKSNIDAQNETPWYLSGRKRKHEAEDDSKDLIFQGDREYNKQASLDPLNKMKEYIDKKKKKKHKNPKEKKHKKHKERHREEVKDKSLPKPSTSKTIEQLRSERLKRENKEKQRTTELFSKLKTDNSQSSESESEKETDRSRIYNSQYNPELSTKSRKHSHRDYS